MENVHLKNQQEWNKVDEMIANKSIPFQLGSTFEHGALPVYMVIDIDPGGGFESGFELTSLSADIPTQFTGFTTHLNEVQHFQFSIHRQDMFDRIGKLFGMEDVETGYPDFDECFIIKTNHPEKLKSIFNDSAIREGLLQEKNGALQLYPGNEDGNTYTLEWMLSHAIFDVPRLKKMYHCFTQIMDAITGKTQ
jgi:hypothetical protein